MRALLVGGNQEAVVVVDDAALTGDDLERALEALVERRRCVDVLPARDPRQPLYEVTLANSIESAALDGCLHRARQLAVSQLVLESAEQELVVRLDRVEKRHSDHRR